VLIPIKCADSAHRGNHPTAGFRFKHQEGELEFGTELVVAEDKSIVALLGASPGASTAASIAIGVLKKCFKDELTANRWLPKLKEIIPSYGESLIEDAALTRQVRGRHGGRAASGQCLNIGLRRSGVLIYIEDRSP
jgi:hypothetical protein